MGARNDIWMVMRNDSGYTIDVDKLGIVHGQAGAPIEGSHNPMHADKGEEYRQWVYAVGDGAEAFYYLKSGPERWGFKFATPPNETNYFSYGYWGWPKEFKDVETWLNGAEKFYSKSGAGANRKFYGPGSSAAGSMTEVDMQTEPGISGGANVIIHFFKT